MNFVEQKQRRNFQMFEERINDTDKKTHIHTVNMLRMEKKSTVTIGFKYEQKKKRQNVSLFRRETETECVCMGPVQKFGNEQRQKNKSLLLYQ